MKASKELIVKLESKLSTLSVGSDLVNGKLDEKRCLDDKRNAHCLITAIKEFKRQLIIEYALSLIKDDDKG